MATKRKSNQVDPVLATLNGAVKPDAQATPTQPESTLGLIGRLDKLGHDTGSIAVGIARAILTAEQAPTGLSVTRAAVLADEFVKSKGIAVPVTAEEKKSSSYGTLVSVWTTRLQCLHIMEQFYARHIAHQVQGEVPPHKQGCGWSALTTYARRWLDDKGATAPDAIVDRIFSAKKAAAEMRDGLTPNQKAGLKLYPIIADTELAVAFRKELLDVCGRHGIAVTDPKLMRG